MPCKDPCNACQPGGLPILFTRYAAAFSADPQRESAIRQLKPSGQFKSPAVPMQTAHYAVRMLREGVLYVLIERAGAKRWYGHVVHPHGYLSPFDPEATPEPAFEAAPACEVVIRGANKSLVWVPYPESVTGLWYFFHPSPVLGDILAKLKADPSKLHSLDVAKWVEECPPTPHTCVPSELPAKVGEWAALRSDAMREGLNEQLYGLMGVDTAEQAWGRGQIPLYANAALNKTTTQPPPREIFSADNPLGAWRKTDRLGPGTLPSYLDVHGARLCQIQKVLEGDPANGKPMGVVAACADAIGIAQEMNHWRNKPYRDFIRWGDVVEPTPDASNRQSRKTRFEVANTWAMMAPLFKARRVALAVRAVAYGQGVGDRPAILEEMTEAERRAPRQGRVFATRAEYETYMDKLRQEGEATMGPRADKQWDKYSASLNLGAMDEWRKAYTKKAEHFEEVAALRAPDSLAWIKSALLLDTLAYYNGEGRRSLVQGVRCAAQINGVIEGLGGGGKRCEDLLTTWAWDHSDNPLNLLWRSFLFNQEDAQASLAEAMAGAQAPGKSAAEQAQGWKNIIDKFAKYNDLMERHNEASLKIGKAIPLFGASAVMTETLHMVFRHSAGERGWENKLARGLMASRLAGTGSAGAFELYVQMQADLKKVTPQELLSNKNFTAAHAQGKLRQARDNAVGKVIAEGGRGEFYKLRLGGAITAVESWLLLAKAKELANAPSGSEEAVRRAVLEFTAASLTTTAATLEIGALMQEWLAAKTRSQAASQLAHIRLGGFKLAGNALAGVAGVVGAYYDFKDGAKAWTEDKYALAWVVFARGVANGLAVGVGVALGLSYAGPLLEHLGKTNGIFARTAPLARWMATRRPWLLAATWWLTFTVIALSFVVALVSDDAMEKWCARSGFRKPPKPDDKPEPLYTKAGEELTELYGAFQGVSMAQKP